MEVKGGEGAGPRRRTGPQSLLHVADSPGYTTPGFRTWIAAQGQASKPGPGSEGQHRDRASEPCPPPWPSASQLANRLPSRGAPSWDRTLWDKTLSHRPDLFRVLAPAEAESGKLLFVQIK